MDMRRLTYFLAVVDHGGFTAAADEVGVSQPALSLAVKELERELEEASATLGASRVQTLRRVALPQRANVMTASSTHRTSRARHRAHRARRVYTA